MATMRTGGSVTAHLNAGAHILAAAEVVETRLIRARLDAFGAVHTQLLEEHETVRQGETALSAARRALRALDTVQDATVETLARRLAGAGQPRLRPFAAWQAPRPSTLVRLPYAKEARVIHDLAARLLRLPDLAPEVRQAAYAADQAATAVEAGLAVVEMAEQTLRRARHMRHLIAREWTQAVAALKRAARAAADDGAPHLYAALFEPRTRYTPQSARRRGARRRNIEAHAPETLSLPRAANRAAVAPPELACRDGQYTAAAAEMSSASAQHAADTVAGTDEAVQPASDDVAMPFVGLQHASDAVARTCGSVQPASDDVVMAFVGPQHSSDTAAQMCEAVQPASGDVVMAFVGPQHASDARARTCADVQPACADAARASGLTYAPSPFSSNNSRPAPTWRRAASFIGIVDKTLAIPRYGP